MRSTRWQGGFALAVLLGINTMNFYDRQVLGAVAEPIKQQWGLSDTALGWLGTAFILLYAAVGLPLGWWADTGRRKVILALGVLLWSVMTAASGLATGFWSLFLFRLLVGVGEASCAPAANSLIGDLFPAERRARALAVFMLGLPVGLALSFQVSGWVAARWSWREALFVAGLPGLLFGLLTLFIHEPPRGAAEKTAIGAARRSSWAILAIPTMWWVILSGAVHNFNMYAIGHFLSPYLMRYHGLGVAEAGAINAQVYFVGGLGILAGGWLCDRAARRRVSGRMEVATLATLLTVPCLYLALRRPPGDVAGYRLWMLPACLLLYVYYAGVYATIQDVVEPALRGTAMALYFFAMYLLGAALGPFGMGWISDHFADRQRLATIAPETAAATLAAAPANAFPANLPWAALVANVREETQARANGLHDALGLVVPILALALVVVLFAASRTVRRDHERLQEWMRQQ